LRVVKINRKEYNFFCDYSALFFLFCFVSIPFKIPKTRIICCGLLQSDNQSMLAPFIRQLTQTDRYFPYSINPYPRPSIYLRFIYAPCWWFILYSGFYILLVVFLVLWWFGGFNGSPTYAFFGPEADGTKNWQIKWLKWVLCTIYLL